MTPFAYILADRCHGQPRIWSYSALLISSAALINVEENPQRRVHNLPLLSPSAETVVTTAS
jgi:hypothetical protein